MARKMWRVAVVGFAHMHVNTLIDAFHELDCVQWVGCADTEPDVPSMSQEFGTRKANLGRAIEFTGIPHSTPDYRQMLEETKPDVVICCSENALHRQVVEHAALVGAHILVEKPMAASMSDALKMVRAVNHAGVKLVVNWPSTWFAAIRAAHNLVEEGEIGEVLQFKYRNGASLGPMEYGQQLTKQEKGAEWWHQAAPGGGAFLDYCCYGACLSRWFIGEGAVAATGMKANLHSHYGDAEDNGIVMVRFPRALAVLEGSWTTYHPGVANGPVVYGTKGTLVCELNGQISVYQDKGRREPTLTYTPEPLPAARNTIGKEFIHHLETDEPLHPTLDLPVNLDAMAILDAGSRSAASGALELVSCPVWQIG